MAGRGGRPLGRLPYVPRGRPPRGVWVLETGSRLLGGFPGTAWLARARQGFHQPSGHGGHHTRLGIADPATSDSGHVDTQTPGVPADRPPILPGTSQWPRPGAPGALSPSYDGGLHSLVSCSGCVGAVPHGRLWPGEGMVHVDPGPQEVAHEGSSACLLWSAYRAWKPCLQRAARAL